MAHETVGVSVGGAADGAAGGGAGPAAAGEAGRHGGAGRADRPARAGRGLFHLEFSPDTHLGRIWTGAGAAAAAPLERLLRLDRLNEVYRRVCGAADRHEFLLRTLDELGVRFRVDPEDLARVPTSGPLVVVSNHPFGGVDGMVLAAVLSSVRRDVKVVANHLLGRITELRDLFLFVNPFGGPAASAANVAPLRQGVRWLRNGGALVIFPAGEVAHLNLWQRQVTDPPWNPAAARIARQAGAAVLPVYFEGRNGPLFQALGLLHPRLRTALLPREMFRRRDQCVSLRVGSPIPPRRISELSQELGGDDVELTRHLRHRTFLLAHRTEAPALTRDGAPRLDARGEPIVGPVPKALLRADVAALPSGAALLSHDGYTVFHARAPQVRNVLREIGRLREATFRAAGEGTGTSIDLDTFDYDYVHLFVWNDQAGEVVGAYRLGATDEILPEKGRGGLYTSTLFDYRPATLRRLGPALEMGRSFVRAEYQKSYAPLLLLWKGIGHYVVRHPRYRHLFGAVSISNSYQSVSRQLLVEFLRRHHSDAEAARGVRPRTPFRPRRVAGLGPREGPRDAEELSSVVAELEPDRKGVPVLVRQYLKLGAKFVAFGLDPGFGDCVDGLIVVDLLRTQPRVLERYMTPGGYASFVRRHRPAVV